MIETINSITHATARFISHKKRVYSIPPSIKEYRDSREGTLRLTVGFTLVEVLVVIILVSLIMVIVFTALDRVRTNEDKLARLTERAKEIYLLEYRLSELFKQTSGFMVINNRQFSCYFQGDSENVVFLSRSPLFSPFRQIHWVELRFDKKKQALLYRETLYSPKNQPVWKKFEVLLNKVKHMKLDYYALDPKIGQWNWQKDVDTFLNQPLPFKMKLTLFYDKQHTEMLFQRAINDKHVVIPPPLLK